VDDLLDLTRLHVEEIDRFRVCPAPVCEEYLHRPITFNVKDRIQIWGRPG